MVVGTSVGALNGTVVADDPDAAADRLAALWSTVTREDVFGKTLPTAYRLASRQSSAIDSRALQAFVERAIASRDFADLKIPHTAITTDFDTGEMVSAARRRPDFRGDGEVRQSPRSFRLSSATVVASSMVELLRTYRSGWLRRRVLRRSWSSTADSR